MGSLRRLQKELSGLQTGEVPYFREVSPLEDNLYLWTGLLLPDSRPYNLAAFRLELSFPAEYPFRAPKVRFRTPIYHPNVSEAGEICLEAVSPEKWKPSTKVQQVIEAVAVLVNKPQPEHPLRPDLAEEFLKEQKKFLKNAADHAKKHGEKRPPN